jgi:predicted Zn finger-like uncharacterized protein
MDVSCPACAARYTCDDEKLRGKTARMRCKACNTVWLVSGAGAGAVATDTEGSPVSAPADGMAKRAAVVKKGADREKRDLFAQRDVEESPVSSMPSSMPSSGPPPSYGFGGGVGARNETSVLFRVDQLAIGRVKTPEATPALKGREGVVAESRTDEEGVIDLKALSSTSGRPALGRQVAPLFSEPPPVTLEVAEGARPNAKPTSKLAIAGAIFVGVAALAAAVFGLSIAFRGEEPVKHAAAVVPLPPPPPPTATAPAPPPAPSADTAAAANDHDATPAKGKKGRRGKARAAAGATAGAAPAKAAKAADPCGCHGDFNCVLACSAKGAM